MTQIKKYEQLTPQIKEALAKAHIDDLQVGDTFICTSDRYLGEIARVKGFEHDKKYGVYVLVEYALDWEGLEWETRQGSNKYSLESFHEYFIIGKGAIKLERDKSVKRYYEEALALINGKIDISVYQAAQMNEANEERAMIHKGSKQALEALQKDLESRRAKADLMKAFVSYEMERRRQELNKIREQLNEVLADFNKKITKIMKVIRVIELYLGIEEELFQIQDGPKAAATEPVQFRQAVLYMDEEMGIWENGGLDFKDIKLFDAWLVKDENFKKLLPESKGMVAFRPRRKEKYYSDDAWKNAIANEPNLNKTYLLIRNGEMLYRIFTEKITILPRLFPQRKELETILEKARVEIEKETFDRYKEEKRELVEDMFYQYKTRAALMQGLIDRSEVFQPIAQQISIFKLNETGGLINFIYDDDMALPSGRLPFWDWANKINSKIVEGSRVLITGVYNPRKGYYSRADYSNRFFNRSNTPDVPKEGVYLVEAFGSTHINKFRKLEWEQFQKENLNGKTKTNTYRLLKIKHNHYRMGRLPGSNEIVESTYPRQPGFENDCYFVLFTKKEQELTIRYKPNSKTSYSWTGGGEERKNMLRFIIFKTDSFILNYDQIDLDDVNFYLTSRVDRHNYLDMMPVLEKIREQRLKEIANEKEFIRFVVGRTASQLKNNKAEALRRTLECVRWWKYKNKWKRPITSDDTLALRMIEKRLLSSNYANFKHYTNKE